MFNIIGNNLFFDFIKEMIVCLGRSMLRVNVGRCFEVKLVIVFMEDLDLCNCMMVYKYS